MSKQFFFKGFFALMCVIFITSCNNDNNNEDIASASTYEEIVAVANKNEGTVTLIDANTNQIKNTISISGSELMYVVYVSTNDKLYVGDRAGKKIHIINPKTKVIENAITVGNGVFHMWADKKGKQLWVNNAGDKTTSVIDLTTNKVIKTINIGMTPHDVFVTEDGTKAYVSVFNNDSSKPDMVYKYNTSDFTKTNEVEVGKDPHLFHFSTTDELYVPCQSGELYKLNGTDLSIINKNNYAGVHGIFPSPDYKTLYLSDLPGSKLYSFDTKNNTLFTSPLAINTPTPHNLVVNSNGNKLFVTHKGKNVSIYTIKNGALTLEETLNTGSNPFGLTYYKRKVK